MLAIFVVVIFFIPLAWSGALAVARGWEQAPRSDGAEKALLALMLAPIGLGVFFLVWSATPTPYAPPPLAAFAHDYLPLAPSVDVGATAAEAPRFDWLSAGAWALILVYAGGLAWRVGFLARAQLRLARIARGAEDASALWGRSVRVSAARVSPFLALNGDVIMPRMLVNALAARELHLIISHERAHHARGDHFYYLALAWIAALLWFNPFVRRQVERCRAAAEIACDARVTAAAPDMRRAYARALVSALKHTAGSALPCAPAVFSTRSSGEHRMRIAEIMQSGASVHKRAPWFAFAAAALLAAPVGALQLAYAQPEVVVAPPVISAAPQFALAVVPVSGRVTSRFGDARDPATGLPPQHRGIDFAAPEGAPVSAAAAGRVVRVAEWRNGYGKFVDVAHADGLMTRYAHLSAFSVREGDQVAAGQMIGAVGETGLSNGPHLHLEVWRDGERIDPSSVLPPH